MKNKSKSSYSMPVRVLAIALSVLLASGAVVSLISSLLGLFGVA